MTTETLTHEDYRDIFEQSEADYWMTSQSIERIADVFNGKATEARVNDGEDGSVVGTFTMEKLVEAWAQVAREAGYEPDFYYHETSEHDAGTYDKVVQLAIMGEVVYG